MSLYTESYGTVFEPNFPAKSESYVLKTLSVSEGKDKDGKTVYSYWNAHFTGKAKEAASSLPEKSSIKFKGYVKKFYNKETKKEYNYLQIYEYELAEPKDKQTATEPAEAKEPVQADANLDISIEDLPF